MKFCTEISGKILTCTVGRDPLFKATLSNDAVHHGNLLEYDVHNLFGYMEMRATTNALKKVRKERALVISRSTYAGAGKHGGHWTGEISVKVR
jgi:alpha-glucosidase